MRVLLFTGKGGVGKTTLAAATATRLAAAGRKALVVSTDPAHSLADVLGVALTADPVEVDPPGAGGGGLFAAQIDTRALVDGAWSGLAGHLGTVLAGAGVNEVVADELTMLPGVEELLALTEVAELAGIGPWEVVLVDCAPTAETLRLLALPEAVSGYLERLFPAHRRMVRGLLAGLAGARASTDRWDAAADALSRLAERTESLRALLTDPHTTAVRLVLTPERVVVAETRRTLTALALLGVRVDRLLVNRLVPAPAGNARGAAVGWLRARRTEQDGVLAELDATVAGCPLHTVGYRAAEPVGLAALAELGAELGAEPELDQGPGGAPDAGPLLSVRRTSGAGRDLDAEFELAVNLRLDGSAVDLARIGDELAVTVDGRRRLLALPSVLRRCTVTGADQRPDRLLVRFRPDPAVWLR